MEKRTTFLTVTFVQMPRYLPPNFGCESIIEDYCSNFIKFREKELPTFQIMLRVITWCFYNNYKMQSQIVSHHSPSGEIISGSKETEAKEYLTILQNCIGGIGMDFFLIQPLITSTSCIHLLVNKLGCEFSNYKYAENIHILSLPQGPFPVSLSNSTAACWPALLLRAHQHQDSKSVLHKSNSVCKTPVLPR